MTLLFVAGNPATFWDVFDLVNVIWAVCIGFGFGITVLLWLNLKFPPAAYIEPFLVFAMTFTLMALIGLAFFASQIADAVVHEDQQGWRIVARLALWLLFSLATAVGLGLGHRVAIDSPQSTVHPSSETRKEE